MTTASKTVILALAVLLAGINAWIFTAEWQFFPLAVSAALLVVFIGGSMSAGRKNDEPTQ